MTDKIDVKEYYGGGWYEEKIREVAGFIAESEKPVAVCMVGVPGSGKSHFACCLAECAGNMEVISTDAIRRELLGDEGSQDRPREVFGIFFSRIRAAIAGGHGAICDGMHAVPYSRGEWLKNLRGMDCVKIAVHMDTPPDIVFAANGARERKVPERFIAEKMAALRPPETYEGFDRVFTARLESRWVPAVSPPTED